MKDNGKRNSELVYCIPLIRAFLSHLPLCFRFV